MSLPPDDLNLKLAAPIRTWDEAVPLGNGLLGGLLWGEGSTIRLSLDRGDLWDERPANGVRWKDYNYATMRRLVAERKNNEVIAIFDRTYGDAHPTKIPAGRLELTFDPAQQAKSFELHLASAEGRAWFADGQRLDAFFSATQPVALLRLPGAPLKGWKLLAPASVKGLGYPAPQNGGEGTAQWFVQDAAQGLRYCVCADIRRDGGATVMAVTVTASSDGPDVVRTARERVAAALEAGYGALFKAHQAYWHGFWSQSRVSIPSSDILRHYYLVQYFHGAASRRGAPPMPLQGVWTADAGGLPPWKGDYHNDLNTQMTYIAYQTAGRFEEGLSFLDFMHDLLPAFRKFAREFYDAPGAAVPGVMTLAGQPLGGWGQYSLSPVQGAWIGHLFYLHWRYTMDGAFLKERAYPWCREIAECLLHLLKPNANGVLKLPLSASPEIHDNSQRAWLTPNSTYDLACLRMLFLSLAEMAKALGDGPAAQQWRQTAQTLGEFPVTPGGVVMLAQDEELRESHRHHSHLMGIHPFNLLTTDGADREREIVKATLESNARLGTGAWCGYSFSWMSCLRARAGLAESALQNLDIYVKAFILRNGFHANGDQLKAGFSGFTYRPFTLEGNFLAAQAVHEMLLQSWSAAPGSGEEGVIRIFPAAPWRWHEASFEDLRAEGGHRVSARRENNATTWFRVLAGREALVRVRDNFGGRTPEWSREGVARAGSNYEVRLKAGEVLEARLAKPEKVPDAPPDAATELALPKCIKPNKLPLRIGADSNGGNRFLGDIARASVFRRALKDEEIRQLADAKTGQPAALPDCVVSWDFRKLENGSFQGEGSARLAAKVVGDAQSVDAGGELPGQAVRLDGKGYLEAPHAEALDCLDGVTLEAWIRPRPLPGNGARILDKSPAGAATAYLLDTYPGHSLRFITRDPWLGHDAKLPPDTWTHVAATVDGGTGKSALYINGRKVAEQ